MPNLISQSAAKIPPYQEFDWFVFIGVRPVVLETRTHEVQIDATERFGTWVGARGKIYVVHEDAPDIVFPATPAQARSLMSRAKAYKGRVKGKAVTNSKIGKSIERNPDAKPVEPEPIKAKADSGVKAVLAEIRKQPFHKPRSIVYMRRAEDIDGSTILYFDATTSYLESLKKDVEWEKYAEKLLVAAMKGQDVEVGAAIIPPSKKSKTVAVLLVRVP